MSNIINFKPREMKELSEQDRTIYLKTSLPILTGHNGLRPSKIHMILGTPSGGKSTLRNTIIYDFLLHNPNKKVFVWLSEETEEDFKTDLAKNHYLKDLFSNIVFFSEQDNPYSFAKKENILSFIRNKILKTNCNLVILDNITTSAMYGLPMQEDSIRMLKGLMPIIKTPLVILAHTNSGIKEGHKALIDRNDIRGSRNLTNIVEFLYIIQNFYIQESRHTTLRIVKHRRHSLKEKDKTFLMSFDEKISTYNHMPSLTFNELNRLYTFQNVLGKNNNGGFKK